MTSPAAGFWRSDRLAALALLSLGLAVAWQCRSLPLGDLARPGPAAWPLALATLLAGFAAAILLAGATSPPWRELGWGERRHALTLLLAGGFAAAALETLGYRLTMLTVLLFLIGAVERRPWPMTLLVSAGLAFGTHYLFGTLLKLPLPIGLLGL